MNSRAGPTPRTVTAVMNTPNISEPAPQAGDELVYAGETAVVFANATYQFVVVRQFTMLAGDHVVDDSEVLALLIQNRYYRGSFVGTGDGDTTIHGPYQVAAITPERFVPVGASDAEALIRSWAEYAAPLPEGPRGEMEQQVYPRIRAASSIYQLPQLPPEAAETEWRLGIGVCTGFHEFVAIDRPGGTVTLVMATDD